MNAGWHRQAGPRTLVRPGPAQCREPLRYGTGRGNGALAAVTLGAAIAFLDSTVVNVALRVIGVELDASLAELQWVVTGYSLTLAAFILVAGTLGDIFGRRRMYLIGMVGFAVTSLLCAVAPDVETLIAARVLQGIAGALLTPGSLALIQASFVPSDRGRAIGAWTGLTGLAPALGPVVGGALVDLSWRWLFAMNIPLVVAAMLLTVRFVPESRDEEAVGQGWRRVDATGGLLTVLALGAMTYAFIAAGGEGGEASGSTTTVLALLGFALAMAVAFLVHQRRTRHPMVPPELFANRVFTLMNVLTLAVYAALSGLFFFLVLQLQTSLGYSPLAAGLASAPVTIVMLLLAGRTGALATRFGPRLPLTVGCLVIAGGLVWLSAISPGDGYLTDVLPGLLVFAAGLVLIVAPLTTTVLAAAPDHLAGTASGVNNAISRGAGLLSVAALPALVGLAGTDYDDPAALTEGFQTALLVCAGLVALGALLALTLPGRLPDQPASSDDGPAGGGASAEPGGTSAESGGRTAGPGADQAGTGEPDASGTGEPASR